MTKGRPYHVRFAVRADRPVTISASVGQAHAPWQSLRFGADRSTSGPIGGRSRSASRPRHDDADARLTFHLGSAAATVELADVSLHAGGAAGLLAAGEDLGTVPVGGSGRRRRPAARRLAHVPGQTEELLHRHAGLPARRTLGRPLPRHRHDRLRPARHLRPAQTWTSSTPTPTGSTRPSPARPGAPPTGRSRTRPWWTTRPTPRCGSLAATRVAGKPFTVTEYQHPAPNDWAAECIPEISTLRRDAGLGRGVPVRLQPQRRLRQGPDRQLLRHRGEPDEDAADADRRAAVSGRGGAGGNGPADRPHVRHHAGTGSMAGANGTDMGGVPPVGRCELGPLDASWTGGRRSRSRGRRWATADQPVRPTSRTVGRRPWTSRLVGPAPDSTLSIGEATAVVHGRLRCRRRRGSPIHRLGRGRAG